MPLKPRRYIAILVTIIALAASASAGAQGRTSVGLRAGFTTTNDAPVAGLYLSYRFTDHFRLAGDIDYYFRNKKIDAFAFNIDAHIPFALSGKVNIYPLAGLNLTSWNDKNIIVGRDAGDSSTRTDHFGFNVGGGLEYFASSHLRLAVEGKYSYIKDFDGGVIAASIGYVF